MAERIIYMTKDQFVAEKLGLCWHECETYVNNTNSIVCKKCQQAIPWQNYFNPNPDFSTDAGAVELLRLMMGRSGFDTFIDSNLELGLVGLVRRNSRFINVDYVSTPGAFRDAVADWFGWKEAEHDNK